MNKAKGWSRALILLPISFGFLHTWICADAYSQGASSEQSVAQLLYKANEEQSKETVSEKMKVAHEAMKARGTETPKNIEDVRAAVIYVTYQYLIDFLVCAEKEPPGDGASANEACTIKRSGSSREMNQFMADYGGLHSINRSMTLCMAKTRLIQVELRYPPYQFMTEGVPELPRAYDAGLFLECVKSRL